MSIYRKPSKWEADNFLTERILAIANSGGFSTHRYSPQDINKNKRARKLAKEGLLTHLGINGSYRDYAITELGKKKLKELREVSKWA